jgi:acetyl-CoA decarbonylase/synthase complex subunit gamma
MAMSGLDIFKLLPKTNCGDCGVPTCMAFAMKLAQKKAELKSCPHASPEAKAALGAAGEPPIRLIKIGGANHLEVGGETVMFRHEKTFFHPTGIAIQLKTSDGEEINLAKIKEVEDYKVDRVGETLKADLLFVSDDGGNKELFLRVLEIARQNSTKGIVLDCEEEETLKGGLELLKNDRPAIFLRKPLTDPVVDSAKAMGASVIVRGASYDELAGQAEKARQAGLNNLLLNLSSNNLGAQLQHNTALRRGAVKENLKPFGFPLVTFIEAENDLDLLAKASLLICKYSSVIVLPAFDKALLYALLTLRQNIYTDPQKPIQVDPKVYAIGDPTPESPVFITTNFSLTFFIVSGEIENSGTSAHLVVCDTEGQSVLTAWAGGKFVPEKIAKFVKDIKLEEQVKARKIVIPGLVAQISGELEEKLPGWQVIVGCQEAADIPSFVKSVNLV